MSDGVLQISIQCARCQARISTYVLPRRGWDLADVKHECDPGGGSPTGVETFHIEYDPPRES